MSSTRKSSSKPKVLNFPELDSLKDDLDKANNFIDYFLVIGLNPEIALNDWLYEAEIDELNIIYPDKMRPKIISSFPPFLKHTIAYDDSLVKHCFPNNFKIIESKTKPNPEIFSFILDNNYFSIHYPQKYLSCLICYESISEYKKLFDKNNLLSRTNVHSGSNINIETMKNSNISSISTLSNTNNQNSLNNNINSPQMFFNAKNKNYYIPKCLMFISLYPFFGEYEKILSQLYYYSLKEQVTIPIDKIIENLIIEIPVPPRGIFNVEYTLIDNQIEIKQNLMNQLPLIDIDLKILFNFFSVEQIVDIYRFIILESRVLFFSKNVVLLNPFIYGMLSLLYPFHYQYQIVTILPKENFETLESITPFIAGINQSYNKNFFSEKGLTLSDNIVIVDIDSKKILIVNGEDNTTICSDNYDSEYKKEGFIPQFPKGHKKNLEKELLNTLTNNNKKNELKESKKQKCEINKQLSNSFIYFTGINDNIDFNFNKEINEAFFNFNTNILEGYSKYLNLNFYSSKGQPDLTSLFKLDEYISTLSSSDKDFYMKFISETQIFGDFLYKRMIPKDSNEKLQILSFDEKINEKSAGLFSKPPPSIFTNSKEYNFINQYRVQKPRTLTETEIQYYKSTENQKLLLSYGVYINQVIKNKNNPDEDTILFSYPIFPILTTDIFFQLNIKEYFIPLCLTEEIEPINADIVSKSHLGAVEVQQSDMENYIDLCWVQIWAMSFWYCDPIEKKPRFNQLMQVMEKVTHHEMEIFNLLFDTLSKYGEDYMILELYEMIIQLKLNPSVKVRETVMKMLDKKKFRNLSEENFLENLKQLKNEKYQGQTPINQKKKIDKSKFRKRTFKNKYNSNVLNEEVTFYAFDTCINCQRDINLEVLSQNYKEMIRDILWAKCPFCSTYILPKISIKFGNEMNKQGKLRQNTSIFDCVILFSPQYLKLNYNNSLIKEYGTQLDIDEFKMKYNALFWNSIWYFKLKGLDYDFFLPYETYLSTNVLAKVNSHLHVMTSHIAEIEKNKKKRSVMNRKKNKKYISLTIESQVTSDKV